MLQLYFSQNDQLDLLKFFITFFRSVLLIQILFTFWFLSLLSSF